LILGFTYFATLPRQFVILGLVLIACLQACTSIDHGPSDNPKTGYIYGTVVGITDGDTQTILTAINKTAKIRLAEIDTPERGQPYGNRAKRELSDLTFKTPVAIRLVDIDRYERIVGRIYADDLDVSAELVRLGAAWVYRKHAEGRNLYDEARADKRGLWGLPEAERMPPWEWRRR
jgi:micrococcal nuclease